jgi:GNAT superfamily N-acetyltransferase
VDACGGDVRVLKDLNGTVERLAVILQDAVDDGAGVSFLPPLSDADARAFWSALDLGATTVLVAEVEGEVAGCVLMQRAWPPNQPHRVEVAKLLVHRDFRRRQLGTQLMRALERHARDLGFTLITFDAVAHGPVEAFYQELGFVKAGVIPGYAYSGDVLCDTAIFYKQLS